MPTENSLFETNKIEENKNFTNQICFPIEWLSTEEAAQYLRLNAGTLRNMVCNGRIKVRGKAGRLNRFHIDDLKEFLIRK